MSAETKSFIRKSAKEMKISTKELETLVVKAMLFHYFTRSDSNAK